MYFTTHRKRAIVDLSPGHKESFCDGIALLSLHFCMESAKKLSLVNYYLYLSAFISIISSFSFIKNKK